MLPRPPELRIDDLAQPRLPAELLASRAATEEDAERRWALAFYVERFGVAREEGGG